MVGIKIFSNIRHSSPLLKVFLEKTPSIFFISTINIKKKIKFTLKVSLEKTPFIIP